MKINGKFIMREIAGETILVPVGETSIRLSGVISLNEAAIVIWKGLENGKDREAIVKDILEEYDVSEETARADLEEFLAILEKNQLLED